MLVNVNIDIVRGEEGDTLILFWNLFLVDQ